MNTLFSCSNHRPARTSKFRPLPWLAVLAAVLVSVPTAFSAPAEPTGRVLTGDRLVFGGSIKPVAASLARPLDASELDEKINFEVALAMRQPDVLRAQQAEGRVAPPEELEANHLPLATDFDAVADWLAGQGFKILNRDAHRLAVFARGTVAQAQAAFRTPFARVDFEGKSYLSAIQAPSVPSRLAAVDGVLGLQPQYRAHAFFHLPETKRPATSNQPPYLVGELLGAYNAKTTLTGLGQRIGIVIDVPPASSDLTAFWQANNIDQSLSRISSLDTSTPGTTPGSPSGEETLDVSWSSGIAPHASVKVFASGTLSFVNIDNSYSVIAARLKSGAEPNLHQLSLSFGSDEDSDTSDQLALDHSYFAAIASYGVSIFVSSGDNGAFDRNFARSVSSPASDPSVTAVGGTSVTLDADTGAVTSETAWTSDGQGFSDGRIAASGGGVSGYWPHPAWQTGRTVPVGYSRLVPDVASSADQNKPGYLVITINGTQYTGGYANGTSWAAPTWAGLCTLINQARANKGLAPVGFLNPKIYPLVGTGRFRDITTGDNQYPGYPGYGYDAKVGYDMVTGLGSPNFANLLKALVPPAPAITSAQTASGKVGTAFTYQIAASNNPTSYGVAGLKAGLTVNSKTGLISGTPTASGKFIFTLKAANDGGVGTQTLTVTIAAVTPVITSAGSATGTVGKAFSYQITAKYNPASFGALGLPGGLKVDGKTGVISGTPTAAGVKSLTLKASNSAGIGTAPLKLTVAAK